MIMEVKNMFCRFQEVKLSEKEKESGRMEFSGYGAVFGNIDSYGDVIAKGAFAESIAMAKQDDTLWPALLMQHGGWGIDARSTTPVGAWLDFREDDHGLFAEAEFNPESERAREAYGLLKMKPRPGIRGLSIGYTIPDGGQEVPKEPLSPKHKRNILKATLWEVSLVTFPANKLAKVQSVKSAPDKRFIEQILCDAGLSRRQAKAIIADGYNAAFSVCDEQSDAGEELKQLIRQHTKALRGHKENL